MKSTARADTQARHPVDTRENCRPDPASRQAAGTHSAPWRKHRPGLRKAAAAWCGKRTACAVQRLACPGDRRITIIARATHSTHAKPRCDKIASEQRSIGRRSLRTRRERNQWHFAARPARAHPAPAPHRAKAACTCRALPPPAPLQRHAVGFLVLPAATLVRRGGGIAAAPEYGRDRPHTPPRWASHETSGSPGRMVSTMPP